VVDTGRVAAIRAKRESMLAVGYSNGANIASSVLLSYMAWTQSF